MKRNYSQQDLKILLQKDLPESDRINKKMQEAYQMIRENKRKSPKRTWKKISTAIAGTAAAAAIGFGFCAANPVLAAKLPLIGHIFQTEENNVSYRGDYSSWSSSIKKDGGSYSQTSNGVTVTISEYYADSMSMYLALNIESEKAFSEKFIESVKNTDLSYESIQMNSTAAADLSSSGIGKVYFDPAQGFESPYFLEGSLTGDSAFSGILRVGLSNFKAPDASGKVHTITSMPDNFAYELDITDFYVPVIGGTETDAPDQLEKISGEWSFFLPIKLDNSKMEVQKVNETNKEGIGIGTVRKSAYEIEAELLLPETADRGDYIAFVIDAEGKKLETRGGTAEVYDAWQKDLSTAVIGVCEYETFMQYKQDAKALLSKTVFQTSVHFSK